jgi:hypothetical protein
MKHSLLHPSPDTVLPSSQVSGASTKPSPHTGIDAGITTSGASLAMLLPVPPAPFSGSVDAGGTEPGSGESAARTSASFDVFEIPTLGASLPPATAPGSAMRDRPSSAGVGWCSAEVEGKGASSTPPTPASPPDDEGSVDKQPSASIDDKHSKAHEILDIDARLRR